jgi:hypothetical protein
MAVVEARHIDAACCQRAVAGHMRDDKTATLQNTQQHTFTCFGTHYSFS